MDFNDLKLLKQLTLEIEEIGKKPEKLSKIFQKNYVWIRCCIR